LPAVSKVRVSQHVVARHPDILLHFCYS
jgi:hypothetical protein